MDGGGGSRRVRRERDMEGCFREGGAALTRCRLYDGIREKEARNEVDRDVDVFGNMFAVVEGDRALAAITTGDSSVAATLMLVGKKIRADDGRLESGCVVAFRKNVSGRGTGTWEEEVSESDRVMNAFVSNFKNMKMLMLRGNDGVVPERAKAVGGVCHGAAVNVSADRTVGTIQKGVVSEDIVHDGGTGLPGCTKGVMNGRHCNHEGVPEGGVAVKDGGVGKVRRENGSRCLEVTS